MAYCRVLLSTSGLTCSPKFRIRCTHRGEVRHHFLYHRRTGDDRCSLAHLHLALPFRLHGNYPAIIRAYGGFVKKGPEGLCSEIGETGSALRPIVGHLGRPLLAVAVKVPVHQSPNSHPLVHKSMSRHNSPIDLREGQAGFPGSDAFWKAMLIDGGLNLCPF